MRLEHLIFTLFFSLSAGTFFSLGVLKAKALDRTYFIYHGVGLAIVAGAAYLILRKELPPYGRWVLGFSALAILFSFTVGRFSKLAWVFFAAGSTMALRVLYLDTASLAVPLTGAFTNLVLSTLLLGLTLSSMLLGHWYLVQPRLSIDELKRVTIFLLAIIAVRLVLGTVSLFLVLAPKGELEAYRYLFSGHPGIFVLMRWTWGLLAPAILSWMIWNTVKIRSTQSATGILYVAVVCVLSGEILSQYLMYFHALVL